jgi:hypothetical protein
MLEVISFRQSTCLVDQEILSPDLCSFESLIDENPHEPLTGEDENGSKRRAIFILNQAQ